MDSSTTFLQLFYVDKKLAFQNAFGHLVRHRRVEVGLTQEGLALDTGLDRTYVSGIERGRRNPTLTVIAVLAAGLKTTTSALLQGLEEEVERG